MTARDIPGNNAVALLVDDQPYLAGEFINYPEEAILLLAHPDRYVLEQARLQVGIGVEPLPAVFHLDESEQVFKAFLMEEGDVNSVWDSADHIVEASTGQARKSSCTLSPKG